MTRHASGRSARALVGAVLLGGVAACAGRAGAPGAAPSAASDWIGTWAAAQQVTEPRNLPPAPGLRGATLRQVVRTSVGGDALRVRFSNAFGDDTLRLAGAHVAVSRGGGAIDPASDRPLTFGGAAAVAIPPGGTAVSDPVAGLVPPLTDLAITTTVLTVPDSLTGHPGSRTTSYLLAGTEAALRARAAMADAVRTEHWYLLAGLDVRRPRGAAVVVLGNSIADGRGSTTDQQNRWPDRLARRLQANPGTAHVAVLNSGMGGNCVLRFCIGPAAVDRFDRDVLAHAGARWVILSEGVNDIGGARGAAQSDSVASRLIAAYGALAARARARGLTVFGATILPFGGAGYDSPEHEAARQRVNAWIRTGGAFDAVIDFDRVMRDPQQPTRLRPEYDTGDHLHPNARGYEAMGDAVDLALFAR